MADLNNLLGELEEHLVENEVDDEDEYEKTGGGRTSMETAATAPMTSDEWESPQRYIDVPVALQQAKRRRQQDLQNSGGFDSDHETHHGGQQQHQEGRDWLGGDLMDDQQGEDEGQMNELYTKLHHMWHQERHCPEILAFDATLVEQIQAQIEARQEWIEQTMEDLANAGWTAGQASVQHLMATMAQVDLDRIKYVLDNWMAQRLAKIEAHPLHMREHIDSLSDAELEYLKEYGTLLEDHLRQTVLDHIPVAWQDLDEAHMIDQPDYQGYHFWMVKEPIEVDEVEQDVGSCLVAKYSTLRDLMKEGKVELQL